jgi:hypothetical protein
MQCLKTSSSELILSRALAGKETSLFPAREVRFCVVRCRDATGHERWMLDSGLMEVCSPN